MPTAATSSARTLVTPTRTRRNGAAIGCIRRQTTPIRASLPSGCAPTSGAAHALRITHGSSGVSSGAAMASKASSGRSAGTRAARLTLRRRHRRRPTRRRGPSRRPHRSRHRWCCLRHLRHHRNQCPPHPRRLLRLGRGRRRRPRPARLESCPICLLGLPHHHRRRRRHRPRRRSSRFSSRRRRRRHT